MVKVVVTTKRSSICDGCVLTRERLAEKRLQVYVSLVVHPFFLDRKSPPQNNNIEDTSRESCLDCCVNHFMA